ncbi:MAG: hypothetical protein GX958_06395 [Desulfitobacterium sp.]|nr:hypothetical protein [Desulfitobacterium sp.]
MYSLPIVSYGDFWRTAKERSLTWGGTLILAGSTLVYAPVNNLPNNVDLKLPSFEGLNFSIGPSQNHAEANLGTITNVSSVEMIDTTTGSISHLEQQITYIYRIEDIEIPTTTEYIESQKIFPGTTQVQEEGATGIQRQVIRTAIVDGEVSEEEIIHQFTLNAPKKRVVIQNTEPVERVEADLSQYNVVKTFEVEATAYTYTGNPTATGVWPREGLIAVDPRVIPLGTEVYVEGYGYAIAADTGGAIKGNIIDVFFPSFQTCIEWGRRPVTIHILAKQSES